MPRNPTVRLTAGMLAACTGRPTVLGVAMLALGAVGLVAPQSAAAATAADRVEARLQHLGYPTGRVDGVISARTRQALCAWRETHRLPAGRHTLTSRDARSVLSATRRPYTSRTNGLYVNKTCQMLYQVVDHQYRRIVRISTGVSGYNTPSGTGYVWRKRAGWHKSSIYDARMYDSIYFLRDRPRIALHGSVTNDLVRPYPASHGCVRVWRPQIHSIFLETPIGWKVVVYQKPPREPGRSGPG